MNKDTQQPAQETPQENASTASVTPREDTGVVMFLKNLIKPKSETSSLRETIEELVERNDGNEQEKSVTNHERTLISNVLKVKSMTAADIMVPRADIVAVQANSTQAELFSLLAEKQYSRLPVYKETLDDVIGSVHAKDILATFAQGEQVVLGNLVREVPIISPALPLLDLLLQMRISRKHMVLVVDEYGGIDGLITIGDVIEAIVGEIHDEHDPDDDVELAKKQDGTYTADARLTLSDFEITFGKILSEEEKSGNDTLGGLVTSMAGHVPVRGEVISHSSGIIFEILESDPRRVRRLRIGNLPKSDAAEP